MRRTPSLSFSTERSITSSKPRERACCAFEWLVVVDIACFAPCAVTQIAKAQGAKHAISTTTNHSKAQQARSLGFDEVIDLSVEKLRDGVRRITEGYGADIVIDAMGGEILSESLGTLSIGGSLTTLGYAAGRKTTIDVTDLIWKRASMKSFSLFSQPAEVWTSAWTVIFSLLQSGAVKPIA